MPVISIIVIHLLGWLPYRLFHRQSLELSPASIAIMWVLGTGVAYIIYFLFIALLQQNPPPIMLLIAGGLGAVELIRIRRHITITGWHIFRQAKWGTLILILIVLIMSLSIFMSGFYADTARMWLAKADMLNQLPDYINLMQSLADRLHPDYPMLISHQYQWQLVWSDSLMSLKLSTWVWYVTLLLASANLLTRWTKHPVRWLILLAGYPIYWFVVPIATVDIPLSVMWLIVIILIVSYLDDDSGSMLTIGFVCSLRTLAKNEGFIIIACITAGLLLTAHQRVPKRWLIMRLIGIIFLLSFICFASWYVLVVGQASINLGSDFGLSNLQLERIVAVIQIILPILFNPLETAFLWLLVLGFVVFGYRDMPLIWVSLILYLIIISGLYVFSIRPTSLYEHIIQSYFRLLLHITPLAFVYVARNFATHQTPQFMDG